MNTTVLRKNLSRQPRGYGMVKTFVRGFFLVTALFVFDARIAHGADAYLFLSPPGDSLQVGRTISMEVRVNSGEEAINAVEATLKFDPLALEVVGVSKEGSIFGLWTSDPEFSNSRGTISFGAGTTARFNGNAGLVLTVTFRAKASGNTAVSFSSGAILAADGFGTNIIVRMDGARYSISPPATSDGEDALLGAPGLPQIISTTHPDPDRWYANPRADFIWNAPPGITGIRIDVDGRSQSSPQTSLALAAGSYSAGSRADGIWYLHAQFRNSVGWGTVAHVPFRIDTKKPDVFAMEVVDRTDPTDPRVKLRFTAHDETSDIARYEVEIDNHDPDIWQPRVGMLYESDVLDPGPHMIVARAVDEAGNSLVESQRVTIDPIEAPRIVSYPKQLRAGDAFEIRGVSKPDAMVRFWFERDDGKLQIQEVTTEATGVFTFISNERLDEGVYTLTAQAIDGRGGQSMRTPPITFSVQPIDAIRLGRQVGNILFVFVPLAAVFAVLAMLVWRVWRRLTRIRASIQQDVTETDKVLVDYLGIIRRDINDHIERLRRAGGSRDLTAEEKQFLNQFRRHVDEEGIAIRKEMEKIKHDLES